METNIAAIVNNGIVDGIIEIEPCSCMAVQKSMGYDHLIPVDKNIRVGDTYDEEKTIFLRDGERVFPAKTDSEEIADLKNQLQSAITEVADLKTQIGEMQDAFVELGDIIAASDGASDSGEDGGTDG